jgi:hypothetical protein
VAILDKCLPCLAIEFGLELVDGAFEIGFAAERAETLHGRAIPPLRALWLGNSGDSV